MELRATRELRRSEQLDKILGKKEEASDTSAKARTPQPQEPADKFTLSRQALAFVDEQQRKLWDAAQERGQGQAKQNQISGMLDAMETQKNELDSMSKKLKMMNKCQKIAAAIMRGDRVPPEDLRYLMEHDPEGYKLIKSMCIVPEDDEECDSVLEDEEDNNSGGASASGEAAPVEVAAGGGDAPPSSGGEAPSDGGACE